MIHARNFFAALLWLVGSALTPALADDALVAVAANFADTARQLAQTYSDSSEHQLVVAVGSTGKLYAQIINGAPFDVLLAADQRRPQLLVASGHAVATSPFTFARGQLMLWSADAQRVTSDPTASLLADRRSRVAIANPKLAPYGEAARETLETLQLWEPLSDRLVRGENVAQAFAMAASGNADFAFVAASMSNLHAGSRWLVPQRFYTPIRQDAVLLSRAAQNPAAKGFLAYLASIEAQTSIRAAGYATESGP